jgi:hypothetical protein
MKISDILHQIADAIDQQPQGVTAPATQPGLTPDHDGTFLPPLQAKLELLKKAVGVDSVFDPGEPRADQAHDNQPDELDIIRRHAGVPVAAIQELSNDELLDD